jgi:phosphomannomutase
MNSINFIFDIDGTLTDSRAPIDPKFEEWLIKAVHRKHPQTTFTLISGSDLIKVYEQLSFSLVHSADLAFGCSGTEDLRHDNHIDFVYPPKMRAFLEEWLNGSIYPHRQGNHFEHRNGCINFSIVGRNANETFRADYNTYDQIMKEREQICRELMQRWPKYRAMIGGKISIDIMHNDHTKAQILNHFDYIDDQFIFYGDGFGPYGNDIPLAEAIMKLPNPKNRVVWTSGWRATWDSLKQEKFIFGD